MLTTGSLQLTSGGQKQYLASLHALGNVRGNSRSATMRRGNTQGPVVIGTLTADCKVMRLHEKPVLEVRSKQVMTSASSMVSVYAARPLPITRASADTITKVKSKGKGHGGHKALLQRRTNSPKPNRNLDKSPLRRSTTVQVVQSCEVMAGRESSQSVAADKKATKVFLSQKQSSSLKDCGMLMPCAPPATPTPEHLRLYDYVPSLTDVKSQRHMRQRLEGMSKVDHRKAERRLEVKARQDRLTYKEKVAEQRRRQRQEIYALNKVMTDLEYKNFEEMVKKKGLNI